MDCNKKDCISYNINWSRNCVVIMYPSEPCQMYESVEGLHEEARNKKKSFKDDEGQ